MSLLGTAVAHARRAHPKLRYAMRCLNEEPADKLVDMAERAETLVHEAHDVLERMDTNLTLAEAKLALTRHLIVKRHHNEQST
jgi:hypothetical protein